MKEQCPEKDSCPVADSCHNHYLRTNTYPCTSEVMTDDELEIYAREYLAFFNRFKEEYEKGV